jgi:choline dehydrogenase
VSAEYDFIVVGSGAGGGPLACNLALAPEGFRVALLEAGTDPCLQPGSREFYNYLVPALHTNASEDQDMTWSFFVDHYADAQRQQKDSKYQARRGIFYPRAAAVGGCTAHHALITVYPHQDDWKRLETLTGDPSWSPENMRKYFERLEECRYVPRPDPRQTTDPVTRHGFDGWLPVSMPDPTLALGDGQLLRILLKAFLIAFVAAEQPGELTALLDEKTDPESKKRSTTALNRAVGHLLDTARRVTRGLPETVRATIAGLSAEVNRLESSLGTAADLLNLYAEAPSLLELFRLAYARLDPNRWFDRDADRVGVFNTPASILHGVRSGVRERVLSVRALYPDRLHLLTNALATEVLVENGRAVGVRYITSREGPHLYRASPRATPGAALPAPQEVRLRPRGEVILAGGAFNTPQLLMLSGVGPAAHLRAKGLAVKCDLPGVGQNLQDRYEICLTSELPAGFQVLEGSKFQAPDGDDPADQGFQEWKNHRGVYASNGVVLSIIKRSGQAEDDVPDLFIFGLPGYFRGYVPGYSRETQGEKKAGAWVPNHRRFTWAILKGRARNRGEVSLTSKDPRDPPHINFRQFDEGGGDWKKDLDALVEGVRFAGQIMQATGLKAKTLVPDVDLGNTDQLRDFILREAWGHHACGTCKIGKDEKAVLDGDFRVRGVENLRVVDASVFPDIPGFFIVLPIFMISEKASDAILADRRRAQAAPWPEPVRA